LKSHVNFPVALKQNNAKRNGVKRDLPVLKFEGFILTKWMFFVEWAHWSGA